MGAYGCMGAYVLGGGMDVHACQLHLKEYIRGFPFPLIMSHVHHLSTEMGGGQKTCRNA